MNRRRFIQSGAGVGVLGFVGCIGNTEDDDADDIIDIDASDVPRWADEVQFEDIDDAVFIEGSRYTFSPGTEEPIVVSKGDEVGLAFSSIDGGYHQGHGIAIDEYSVDLKTVANGVDWTTFVADTRGEYLVYCNVYCSDRHDEMTGTLVVE